MSRILLVFFIFFISCSNIPTRSLDTLHSGRILVFTVVYDIENTTYQKTATVRYSNDKSLIGFINRGDSLQFEGLPFKAEISLYRIVGGYAEYYDLDIGIPVYDSIYRISNYF